MKLTIEEKLDLYQDRLNGVTWSALQKKYGVRSGNLRYMYDLICEHGVQILYKKNNNKYSKSFKEAAIHRVLLSEEASYRVSIELGLPNQGTLANWIRSYKENGYNIIEGKRGRPTMRKPMQDNKKKEKKETKLEKLEKENEYLRAENEFLKKWNTVVQLEEKRKKKK